MAKKPKAEVVDTFVSPLDGQVKAGHPCDRLIEVDEMAHIKRPLIDTKAIAIIRDEIQAELPAIRNLHQPTAFFCDEVLRALAALEDNQKAYSEKLLIEARHRVATSQEKK